MATNQNKLTDNEKSTLLKLFDGVKGVHNKTIDYQSKDKEKTPDLWLKIDKVVSDEYVKLNKAPRISNKNEIYVGINLSLKELPKQLNNLRKASKIALEPKKLLETAVKFHKENNYPGKIKNISAGGIKGALNKSLKSNFGFELNKDQLKNVHSKVKDLDKSKDIKR